MPAVNIFTLLHNRVMKDGTLSEQEQNARYWFRRYQRAIEKFSMPTRMSYQQVRDQLPDKRVLPANRAVPGHLYFFQYRASLTRPQEYYDALPFVLVTSVSASTFAGLNFHHLPYYNRARLMDALVQTQTIDRADTLKTQILVTPDELKTTTKYIAYRGCYRSYRISRLQSPLLQVGETEWASALFLPVALFRGATQSRAWERALDRIKHED